MTSSTKRRGPSPPALPDAGTGVLIGYARVSSEDQKLELQHDALGQLGCHRLFEDRASGARTDRLDWPLPFPIFAVGTPSLSGASIGSAAPPINSSTCWSSSSARAFASDLFRMARSHFGDGERPCSRSGPFSQKWNAICCGADESRFDLAERCKGNHRPDCPIIDDLADLILEKPVSATLRDIA